MALSERGVGGLDLIEELGLMEPETDEVDGEDEIAIEGDGVAPEVVGRDREPLPMLCPVDLDDQPDTPAHVEVDPSARAVADHLPIRFRETAASAQAGDVELAQ